MIILAGIGLMLAIYFWFYFFLTVIGLPLLGLKWVCYWIGQGFSFQRTREVWDAETQENVIRGQEYRRKALEEYVRTGKKLPGHW